MRDALIAYDAGSYDEAVKLFTEVRQNAIKGFNKADGNIESLVKCTQLKITAVYVCKSYEDGEVRALDRLTDSRRRELARYGTPWLS